MVVEYLTFAVEPGELARWLEVEERIWSRFLEEQPGFVRKQMWVERGDEPHVHAVIWWRDMDAWQAVGADAVARVDELMGPWLREAVSCRTFDVVRDS